VIILPDEQQPKIVIPQDNSDYNILITTEDSNKEIIMTIDENKSSKVFIKLQSSINLPKIEAVKGNISVVIPKGSQITRGASSNLELITTKNKNDTTLINNVNEVIPSGKKLGNIEQIFSMGGNGRVEFSNFITITFLGMSGNEAAFIQDSVLSAIQKYSSDVEGKNSGKNEYAYNNGNDLVIKTNHFTDFVTYSTINTDAPVTPKNYVTLSIDKKTIKKGYVLSPSKVEFTAGESVWDVLKREMDSLNIDYEYSWTPKYGSVYVESISGDGEFDNDSSGSGWMYNVNGWYPNYGASLYKLKDGDVIQWRYTMDLGADLGEDITQWDKPIILVEGIKNNKEVNNETLTFKVTVKDINGKNLTPTVSFNGKTITGTNGSYKVTLKDGENTITIIAIDADGNRVDVTYNVIYSALGLVTNNPAVGGTNPIITEDGSVMVYADSNTISSWAIEFIERATKKGFIAGFNGMFNPKVNISRAEFTKVITTVLGLDINVDKSIDFKDVNQNDWFYPYINSAYKSKIIEGSGAEFRPNDNITREQMAVIIARSLGLKQTEANITINDINKVSNWAKSEVETVVALGLMVGDNGYFNPNAFATREMATVVAMRGYDYKNNNITEEVDRANNLDVLNQIKKTAKFMKETITDPVVASVGGEWTVLGLARSGIEFSDEYFNKYYVNVEETLLRKSGKLHNIKYTEYDRVILALTSIGKNVKNIAGYDLTNPLADFNTLIKQGINGPIFALIALDSKNYEIPINKEVKVQTTREMLIDFILGREIIGGGWALGENPSEADPDITAMAIQSLTPYYKNNKEVKIAVDRGLEWLSKAQKADGGYSSWGSINSESIAQVIVALTSLEIDPHKDQRFIKNGNSAVDALLSFAVSGGGFYHVKPGGKGNGGANPGDVDLMATDQAMYAMVSYSRFVNGQNRLYDMTDVNK